VVFGKGRFVRTGPFSLGLIGDAAVMVVFNCLPFGRVAASSAYDGCVARSKSWGMGYAGTLRGSSVR
jgi:hypothetical protein